ncbi:LysM peptidoglycan-binding domain-containing protein [Halobacillus fulvus]|nr:LysM peptidoglycan-binding domain-containing protein [Halobacillus fulvus]
MFKRLVIAILVATGVTTIGTAAEASANSGVHTVQSGDTLYEIAMKYGVSMKQLQQVNGKSGSMIYPGEQLTLPVVPGSYERDLLARLVEAEAKGESYAGKVAVATVVLNRVESDLFPDSIYGVIYQDRQFTPVSNGTINQAASDASERAVQEALAYQGYDRGSLFFYNPDKATSAYLSQKEVTTIIGNHVFLR